jgi:hypothetical protein
MSVGELLLSVGGIVLTVLAAWLLSRGREGGKLEAGDAIQIAEASLPGFVAERAAVAAHGRAALVVDVAGGLALVRRHGAQWAVRSVPAGSAARSGETITVRLAEPGWREFRLPLTAPFALPPTSMGGLDDAVPQV